MFSNIEHIGHIESDFSMRCILVLFPFFMNNKRAMSKLWTFEIWVLFFQK